MRVRVSAPGKSIFMGEHAAVYHRPALAAAIDRRTVAEIATVDGGSGIRLDLPQVGVREEVTWSEVASYTRRCREAWDAYWRDPRPEVFGRVRGSDPAHLVKIALGEAAAFLGDAEPPAVAVRVDSRIPLGAGFGSSAAAAVAVVDAYLALRGATVEPAELYRLTLEVERRQHGLPSGVDNATVIHGGLVWARKEPSGDASIEPLDVSSEVLERTRFFHSGAPAESTGAVVAAVRERMESESCRLAIDLIERVTLELRLELEQPEPSPYTVTGLIRMVHRCLIQLGVVPEPIREMIDRIEQQGGAAKISGAGALTGRGAGALLVYHPEDEPAGSDCLDGLEPLDLTLGAEGVRRE